MKKISIITICYNEPNLEETCESIVKQTWQDFEWIVIDGGSCLETQRIWDKYKYRIDKFISEKDYGLYDAMNKGIRIATGEYLNFMNAGDSFFENSTLEQIFAQKHTADILYGNLMLVSDNGKKVLLRQIKNLPQLYFCFSTLNHQACFIKNDLFKEFGLYNLNYKIAADYEKFVIFNRHGKMFLHVPVIVCNFNLNGVSQKSSKLVDQEYACIQAENFSALEIQTALRRLEKTGYTLIQRLFSIKNNRAKTHKIITIFNIRIKIKRKKNTK